MFYVIVTRHAVRHVRSHSANHEPMVANEHNAIGSIIQEKMVGHNFGDSTMKLDDNIQPLATLTSSVTMKGEPVVIDQQQMLRCLSIMQSGADLEECHVRVRQLCAFSVQQLLHA